MLGNTPKGKALLCAGGFAVASSDVFTDLLGKTMSLSLRTFGRLRPFINEERHAAILGDA